VSDNEESVSSEEQVEVVNNYSTVTAHRGTQILCNDLTMEESSLLECRKLNVVVKCGRCQFELEISLVPKVEKSGSCTSCHMSYTIMFRPDIMHNYSRVLGYFDKENVYPFDLLPSDFTATCDNCATYTEFVEMKYGVFQSNNCPNCFKSIKIKAENWEFRKVRIVRNISDFEENINEKRTRKENDKEHGIRKGTPLPNNGTCKHYKKSNRWLRFPCCNRAFPCDGCHDENNTNGHEPMRATRMICGFCSNEEPYQSDKPCSKCKKNLTGQSRTSYWEGGQGQRDPVKMKKGEKRKYRGMNKTKSST